MKAETRRMREQRWLIDQSIAAVGVDFSWSISKITLGSTCPEMHPHLMMAINRIKKLADVSREFAGVGARSEAEARKAEIQGHLVTAGEYYYSAANLYAAAQWPIWEDDNETLLELSRKKNTCYEKYIEYATHKIEKVEIPFEGSSLPGYLHLPLERSEKVPCVLSTDGMDGWKEMLVSLHGDKYLERGMAVLVLDGPGQAESSIRKIKCTANNYPKGGKAAIDFLVEHPEIDPEKIVADGISMGSFWIPQVLAYDERLKCAAVALVCQEPGMRTIFEEASPTFKARFMWMAGYKNEQEFDKFAQTLSLRGVGAKIKSPILIMAGEDDELSPIEYTYEFFEEINAPKTLVVFQGLGHGIPRPICKTRFADWITDRLKEVPMESEIIYVDVTGRETKK
jgi:dipeptidyl aminopeptidase/acylaminoacyl peptidase